ncbi:MAG TPA: non-canonical purine NTP pyrophosphatase, RdgB/HAM1 family [Flavobacteriaceae bacterium]|nr:non-canonical purine NTP pyrophosphatase, RdgB/HAM1 family [Flavobacteriaceae bacterium]
MKLIFATHNINKFKEVKAQMPPGIELGYLGDLTQDPPLAETADTLKGNAELKMMALANSTRLNCFADDTGLEVAALNGAPGVYSARYAGPEASDSDNIQKLLKALDEQTNRQAQFRTVIALYWEGSVHFFEGMCRGTILQNPIGNQGFGYDPIFMPEGYDLSFAQMSLEQKTQISHRGLAMQKLINWLQEQF